LGQWRASARIVGRIIAGITGASFSAAGAYVADITPPEKRAQAFGLVGAAFGLGFIPVGSLRALGRHPTVIGLTGTMVCGFMAQMILQSVWALYNQARFDWTLRAVGLSLMVVGLTTALVQGVLVRVLTTRLGERRLLVLGLSTSILGHLAFALADRGWMMYAFIFPFALGGLAGPATQSIISREVGPSEQGELQGSINSLSGLAAIAGPLVGTGLLARFGPDGAHPHIPGAPFFAAAGFVTLGLLLALRLFARASAREIAGPSPSTQRS
jgi:DHA1 family tetracycline resistance protein-like MFS transporter